MAGRNQVILEFISCHVAVQTLDKKMQVLALFLDKRLNVFMLLSPICYFSTNDRVANFTVSHTHRSVVFALFIIRTRMPVQLFSPGIRSVENDPLSH